jgi:hypothetical protein
MYICTSQFLCSHSNRHCNVQIDIGLRADELGIRLSRRAIKVMKAHFLDKLDACVQMLCADSAQSPCLAGRKIIDIARSSINHCPKLEQLK